MRKNAFEIVRDFERAVAEYAGAPKCVAVNSCTNALFLCLKYHFTYIEIGESYEPYDGCIEIPKHTYISVPMQIIHAGFGVKFRDEEWKGIYQLKPFRIWDGARRFTSGMFTAINMGDNDEVPVDFLCVSFHWSKILGIQQGGAILHNSSDFDRWARRARFDGRTEGVHPQNDQFNELGWHCYMSPEIAAEGLVRLMHLPKNNPDLPNDDYPDLSQVELFK